MNTSNKTLTIAFDDSLLSVLKPQGKSKLSRSDAFMDIIRRIRASVGTSESVHAQQSEKQQQQNTSSVENPKDSAVKRPDAFLHGNSQQFINNRQSGIAQQRVYSQQSNANRAAETTKQSPLQQTTPTQCVINYSHLAKDWQWDRATVKSFLENLEQAGVILLETNGKKITLYV